MSPRIHTHKKHNHGGGPPSWRAYPKGKPTAAQRITINPEKAAQRATGPQAKRSVPQTSFWLSAPQDGFTAVCAARCQPASGILLKDLKGEP